MKLSLQNLTKIFPSRDKNNKEGVVAVKNFSLEIPDGKLVALLGPSGCGKSTTLYMISGLETPTEGKIIFGENDVTNLPTENRGVGLVFQNYALYPHLSVFKNISFPLENLKKFEKISKQEIRNKVEEVAKIVQLENLLERKPKELSGGQQQRVAIARALVKKPPVLLLDEPLSNLDARLRLQTREELRRIQKETKITTIFVTHDQDEAMSISDFIVVMKNGEIQQIGKPQEVYENPENLFVAKFLGTPPINIFDAEIKNEKLFIGDEQILDAPKIPNQFVTVGIRAEDFEPNSKGCLTCSLERIEVQGRDTTLILKHDKFMGTEIRAIVDSDEAKNISQDNSQKFTIRKNKIFVFSKDNETRLI